MHSAKAASILILLTLIASPTPALSLKTKAQTDNESPSQSETSQAQASVRKEQANKSGSQRFKHSPARRSGTEEFALPAVSLVSGAPEYLSGEANVTVKGNENPIIRLGLATSGVTLVEFPAADRFFALHPGNSEMVHD